MQGVHWIEPLDAPEPKSSAKRQVSFTGAQRTTGTSGSLLHPVESAVARTFSDDGPLSSRPIREHKGVTVQSSSQNKPNVIPIYTIPANATLLNSTAFSALVGRVPIGGKVQDPMPFKVLIGADNLAANGHHIPGLQGIVMSGYAIGDWTLSCVRGTLTSATFVFDDGHVVVFGEKKRVRTKDQEQDAIGWISDEFGVPCVSGKKITNAPTYLTERVGMVAAQAAAEAAAASQTTTTTSPTFGGSSTTTVTGDQGTYILGKTLSGATKEIGQWLEERMANSFDAVFAPAGTKVAVHLDVTLPIDYDPAGRMLDHRAAAAGPGGAYGYLD
jgi:integrating conjugative element protein (TIGR03752 family)